MPAYQEWCQELQQPCDIHKAKDKANIRSKEVSAWVHTGITKPVNHSLTAYLRFFFIKLNILTIQDTLSLMLPYGNLETFYVVEKEWLICDKLACNVSTSLAYRTLRKIGPGFYKMKQDSFPTVSALWVSGPSVLSLSFPTAFQSLNFDMAKASTYNHWMCIGEY